MSDTRQARIAAAEQAIDDAIWRLMGTRMSITGENLYQQVATAAIDAADAAAPAVGVTVDAALDRMMAEAHAVVQEFDALLTAQPEPTRKNYLPDTPENRARALENTEDDSI